MKDWERDKQWSDKFVPEIKTILAQHLISEAPYEEDALRNTDLIVLVAKNLRIGCRVRRHKYCAQYGHQFTIRSHRDSNNETELSKILYGYGDYFFYGFANERQSGLCSWLLGNLGAFRLWHHRQLVGLDKGQTPGKKNRNYDGSSEFVAYTIADLPENFLLARRQCGCSELAEITC